MKKIQGYTKSIEVIWADLDPNLHMRHTAYSDYATHARISFFEDYGSPLETLKQQQIGAILLNESTSYFREVKMHDVLTISVELFQAMEDYSRFSVVQYFYKENNKKAAKVIIHGAWLHLETRTLVSPPADFFEVMQKMPRTSNFKWATRRDYVFV